MTIGATEDTAARRPARPCGTVSISPDAARMQRKPVEMLRDAGIAFVLHDHVPVATVAEIVVALPFPRRST